MRHLGLLLVVLVMILQSVSAAELKTFNGKQAGISQYAEKGKWLVVMIWASNCHVCNEEARSYDQFYKKHKLKDAVLLGLSIDGKAKKKAAEKFISRHKVTFPNILGEPRQVMELYLDLTGDDTFGTPSFLVYDPKGKLIAGQVGAVPPKLIEAFIEEESGKVN